MRSLRTRLIIVYLVATFVPLLATLWISTALIDRSLGYAPTGELDALSRTLEDAGRRFYQRERDALRDDADAARVAPVQYGIHEQATWPPPVADFWESGAPVRFELSGAGGDHLDLLQRLDNGVALYRRNLGGIRMQELSAAFRETREIVGAARDRDLRRGLTLTLLLLVGAVWTLSLVPLLVLARRITSPIQQLTAGLTDFAGGDWNRRVEARRGDEVGRAIEAFNRMAEQLRRNRDRLVYLTQMSSWQSLARKTAHELKNSLTPIRLTVEEMLARGPQGDRAFMEQAAQIVVSEIETLERRVRAFSELGAEPPAIPEPLDVNAHVRDRLALLAPAYAGVSFECRLDPTRPLAHAGADLVKSILTNLLQNAAEAAGASGTVLVRTGTAGDGVSIDVHDSGPGLTADAAATLFEPTITFKKHGMGLGLSIARKYALLSGGDLTVVPGELDGAGFRVTFPVSSEAGATT